MISRSDLQELRSSFDGWDGPGLPTSLSTECARLLHVSDVTISLFGASEPYTISASSADARTLDEWEFTFNEGPCIEAAASSTSNMTETAEVDGDRWPRLSAKAHILGYRFIAGIPLQLEGRTFATLKLQNRQGAISPETLTDAEQIADEIVSPIIATLSQQSPSLVEWADHDKFHQATGIVMSQLAITAEDAVDVLRAHARNHDRLLTDVADDVGAHILSFSPPGSE